jgi:hypothetical protein
MTDSYKRPRGRPKKRPDSVQVELDYFNIVFENI